MLVLFQGQPGEATDGTDQGRLISPAHARAVILATIHVRRGGAKVAVVAASRTVGPTTSAHVWPSWRLHSNQADAVDVVLVVV